MVKEVERILKSEGLMYRISLFEYNNKDISEIITIAKKIRKFILDISCVIKLAELI